MSDVRVDSVDVSARVSWTVPVFSGSLFSKTTSYYYSDLSYKYAYTYTYMCLSKLVLCLVIRLCIYVYAFTCVLACDAVLLIG